MSVHRVTPTTRKRDQRARALLWGDLAALVAITCFGFLAPTSVVDPLREELAWTAGLLVIAALVLAYTYSLLRGIEQLKKSLVFELTDEALIRHREGWPDITLKLAEISSLYQRQGWLYVKTSDNTQIPIPSDLEGFQSLKQELERYGQVTRAPKPSKLNLVTVPILVLGWGLVFLSHKAVVIISAGVALLVLQAWRSYEFGNAPTRTRAARTLVRAFLVLLWIATFWIIWSRLIVQP